MSYQRRSVAGGSAQAPSQASLSAKRVEENPYDISGIGWANVENKFNDLMARMNFPASGINALEARAAHHERVTSVIVSLLDRAQEECRRLLISGSGEAAEEAGVKVLSLRERFFGNKHLQLIPSYLHLARTKQFLGLYGEAEGMLSLAHFIMLQNQDSITVAMKAEIHQTFGLLYAADDQLDSAVQHMTCATYYLSCLHGPEHILTTFSYFDLGNVFAAKASTESAMALYDSIKEIWYGYLVEQLQDIVELMDETKKMKRYEDEDTARDTAYPSSKAFGAENLADASKMLYGIYGIQKERYRVEHPSVARAEFVLSLFLIWVQDKSEAILYMRSAHHASQLFYGPKHPVVQEMEMWSDKFELPLVSDDTGVSTVDVPGSSI